MQKINETFALPITLACRSKDQAAASILRRQTFSYPFK